MTVETTILIEFNSGKVANQEYSAVAELDDILNDGKTTFLPSEKPIIRTNFSNNLRLDAIGVTDGSWASRGIDSRSRIDTELFKSRETADSFILPVIPVSTSIVYKGYPGSFKTETLNGGMVKYVSSINKTPFLAEFTTSYNAKLYELSPPPGLTLDDDETYNIIMVFYVTVI